MVAFVGGVLSFFSPCVLPLIPGYLANISGTSLKELSSEPSRGLQGKVFLNSVSFTLAFSSIFVVLGLILAGVFGFAGPDFNIWLNRVGGTLIILFGIHTTGASLPTRGPAVPPSACVRNYRVLSPERRPAPR